ncbi:MAG TPA: hypothetical protein VF944_02550 [Candidatus Bathyarchaeia archaeon]
MKKRDSETPSPSPSTVFKTPRNSPYRILLNSQARVYAIFLQAVLDYGMIMKERR